MLILASGSRSRRELLAAAGVSFDVYPSNVDEAAIKDKLLSKKAGPSSAGIAIALATAKALEVSAGMPGDLIIGADQILEMDGEIFDKPADLTAASARLLKLSGRTHQLHAAVVLVKDRQLLWSESSTAFMTMRTYDAAFVRSHLARAGSIVLESVGAYQLEGVGVQLFEKIEGDYFTILGLPMLPLLKQLRKHGITDQ